MTHSQYSNRYRIYPMSYLGKMKYRDKIEPKQLSAYSKSIQMLSQVMSNSLILGIKQNISLITLFCTAIGTDKISINNLYLDTLSD